MKGWPGNLPTSKAVLAATGGALILAAGAGVLTSAALSQGQPQPTRTVTIDLEDGAQGPPGPAGPPGPRGPAGGLACPDGFDPGVLVINAPGGQVRIFTCLGPP